MCSLPMQVPMRRCGQWQAPKSRSWRNVVPAVDEIKLVLLPKDAMDERNVILEIRAGTGGDEASLFAGDLLRMYERYAAKQGWKVEIISASEGSMGGYKEVIAISRSRRVCQAQVRIGSATCTAGTGRRILGAHSHFHRDRRRVAGSCRYRRDDQRGRPEDRYPAIGRCRRPARRQDPSAVRVTHIPTGIVVMMQEDRSQHRNRAKAMAVLRARLYDFERQKRDTERAAERRGQVGSGDRSRAYPHLQFPPGAGERSSHQSYPLQASADYRG